MGSVILSYLHFHVASFLISNGSSVIIPNIPIDALVNYDSLSLICIIASSKEGVAGV